MKKKKKSLKECMKSRLKIKAFLLFIFYSLLIVYSASSYSQKVSISMKDTTVEAIINELRNKTNYDFIFNHEEINRCGTVSIEVKNVPIEDVLKSCLNECSLEFKKIDNSIVIVPKKQTQAETLPKPEVLTQTIRGRVLDADSKTTLPFANVIVLNTSPMVGTVTDEDGVFELKDLPVGRYSLQISFVGYQEAILPELLLGSGKELVVNAELTEKISSIGEATVSVKKGEPLNEMSSVSARSFSVEETKRYAASISDPARMAQAFAGVSGNEDSSNEIVVRGNSPNWMLWRLEGIEIPSPNHFAQEGFTGGSVSILSTNMIGKSDFYTGAFPAEYGSALSGVFDIKLRNGNNQKNEYTFQAGVLGIDLSAEGPFKKGYDGSFLFNYRYSTLSILNNLNIQVDQNTLPNYQDLSFKFYLPTKNTGTFSIWGIGGLSDAKEKYIPDTIAGEEYDLGYTENTKTGMYATGISHTFFPDDKSYIKTIVSQSINYSSENHYDLDSLWVLRENYFDEYKSQANRFSILYNRKLSSRLTMRTGFVYSDLTFDYYYRDKIGSEVISKEFLDREGGTNMLHAHMQTKYKFSDNIIFNGGLHYTYFKLSDDHSVEPRLGMEFKLENKQKISFGYGLHSKNENLPIYFIKHEGENGTEYLPNQSLKMTRSSHYVASYEKMFGTDFNLKIEAYYQNIKNIPVPNNPEKFISPIFGWYGPEDTLVTKGFGRNYGLEFTLQKFFNNNYYFLITSSIFDSKYKPLDGKWRNTKYNANYINNFVGGKEFKWGENRMVSVNTKIIWSGGKRYLPVDLDASKDSGEAVYKMDEIYSLKGKDYFRVDLGVRLHFYKKQSEHVISLDIQNVTNRINTWAILYNSKAEELYEYPMTGLIPILNYRIEF